MLKQSLIYLITTIIVVIITSYTQLTHYLHSFMGLISTLYFKIIALLNLNQTTSNDTITMVSKPDSIIAQIIILVLIPVLIAAIPALIYRLIKKRPMPYFIELVWCLWLVLALSFILLQ